MKKRIGMILVVLGLSLVLVGCGKNEPKDVAKAFTEAVAKGKISTAKKYGTEQTGQMLDMAVSFGAAISDPDFKFVFVGEEIDGDTAYVEYSSAEDPEDVEVLVLIKVDGKWKVNASK